MNPHPLLFHSHTRTLTLPFHLHPLSDDAVAVAGSSVAGDQPHFTWPSPARYYWNEEIGACDEGFDLKFLRLVVFLRLFAVADGLRGRCAVNNSPTICCERRCLRLCLIFSMVLIIGGFDLCSASSCAVAMVVMVPLTVVVYDGGVVGDGCWQW